MSDDLLRHDRYPRSSTYSARWQIDNVMGPNALWQTEALAEVMRFSPGMRVLDLGCGTALSSIFLAREYGVEVWATDLWISASDNHRRIVEAGVEDLVQPIHAEAHALPYAAGFFDAMTAIGSYHYFGTDDLYLGYLAPFVKSGGQLGIVQPGLTEEQTAFPPAGLEKYWKWDFCAWHGPEWWRRHWEKTGLVAVEVADLLPDGWRDWLRWNEVCDAATSDAPQWEAEMLRTDAGRLLGLSRVVATRSPEPI